MVSTGGGGGGGLTLGISVALESWLFDGGGSGRDLDGGGIISSLVDSSTSLNLNVFIEVSRVSTSLRQLLVEVAGVLGVAGDCACCGLGSGWHSSGTSGPSLVSSVLLDSRVLGAVLLSNDGGVVS